MEDRSSQTPKNGSGLGLWFLEGVAEFASDTLGEVLGTASGEVPGIAVIAIFCAGIAFVAYGVFQIT
jgi:hypothetical protein